MMKNKINKKSCSKEIEGIFNMKSENLGTSCNIKIREMGTMLKMKRKMRQRL